MKSPLSLLKVFFSMVDGGKKPEETMEFIKEHTDSCLKAIDELELSIRQLEEEA